LEWSSENKQWQVLPSATYVNGIDSQWSAVGSQGIRASFYAQGVGRRLATDVDRAQDASPKLLVRW
jgi:hypothetical protein